MITNMPIAFRRNRPNILESAVLSTRLYRAATGVTRDSAKSAMQRRAKRGDLVRLQRDAYSTLDALTATPLRVANALRKPSYISLFTALSEAGITTQNPREIQSVTTARSKDIAPEESPVRFSYRQVPTRILTGFELRGGVFIAEPEKAFLDLLYLYGRTFDVASIDLSRLRTTKLRRYAQLYPVRVRRDLATLLPRV